MKKILGLFVLLLLLNGCDDGNVKIQNITFQDVQASSCGETIYKLTSNEAMFIKIPASANAFENDVTLENSPRSIPIGGAVSVTYRAYAGTPSGANICNSPGPISPTATEEWIATSGTIEITTIALYNTPNATTSATQISKYVHSIVFKNLVFSKPSGEQIYESFNFGDYETVPTSLALNFDPADIHLCSGTNLLYNARNNGIEALFIQNFDTTLLDITNLGVPKTRLISSTSNKLTYRLLKTALVDITNDAYFCGATLPSSPEVSEEWIAKDGVLADVTGTIEVTTIVNPNGGNGYQHTIRLKGVTFKKGNSTFYFGNDILLGELVTPN